ncbi:MAG: aminotransferase class III-fold pyridoxal phosphate-dependent enzyme, partial [Nocardioides sp.]
RTQLAGLPGVAAVRGVGSFTGIDLTLPIAAEVVQAAQRAGFLINNTGPATLRLAPALTLTAAESTEFTDAWPAIWAAATEATEEEEAAGAPPTA